MLNLTSFFGRLWGEHVRQSEKWVDPSPICWKGVTSGRKKEHTLLQQSHFPFKMDWQSFHGLTAATAQAKWLNGGSRQLVQFVLRSDYIATQSSTPSIPWSKLPIARRHERQNDPHFLLHLAAITFVPQANRTRVPFVSGARPPLQGTHAPVVLIHVQFGSLDSDHAGQDRTSKKTAPEDQVYYLASPGRCPNWIKPLFHFYLISSAVLLLISTKQMAFIRKMMVQHCLTASADRTHLRLRKPSGGQQKDSTLKTQQQPRRCSDHRGRDLQASASRRISAYHLSVSINCAVYQRVPAQTLLAAAALNHTGGRLWCTTICRTALIFQSCDPSSGGGGGDSSGGETAQVCLLNRKSLPLLWGETADQNSFLGTHEAALWQQMALVPIHWKKQEEKTAQKERDWIESEVREYGGQRR